MKMCTETYADLLLVLLLYQYLCLTYLDEIGVI